MTLSEVALFWRNHAKRDCPSIPVPEAFEAFLADKAGQGLSKMHLDDLKRRVGRFAKDFRGMTVEKINSEMLLTWLKSLGVAPRSVRNSWLCVSNFLQYAARRGWTDAAPQLHESDMPKIKASPKGVLTPDETERLFSFLQSERPHFVAWFALQAFAGIRREEAGRMKWGYFDFKQRRIVVPAVDPETGAQVCKTGDNWVMLDLPENLWAWLELARDCPIKVPANKSRDLVIKGAGLDWPANALRHSFCTYHLSLNGSAEKTALLLRHRNTAQLWRSYFAGLKSKEESERYFAISPLM